MSYYIINHRYLSLIDPSERRLQDLAPKASESFRQLCLGHRAVPRAGAGCPGETVKQWEPSKRVD